MYKNYRRQTNLLKKIPSDFWIFCMTISSKVCLVTVLFCFFLSFSRNYTIFHSVYNERILVRKIFNLFVLKDFYKNYSVQPIVFFLFHFNRTRFKRKRRNPNTVTKQTVGDIFIQKDARRKWKFLQKFVCLRCSFFQNPNFLWAEYCELF